MPNVTLRDAVTEDAPALARLYTASRAAALPGLREAHDAASITGWLAAKLMAQHRVRVAEAAGQVVGYIGHGIDPVRGPMVFHLYLAPDWRRMGIGSILLAQALSAHEGRLSLFCIARNAAARTFYEAHGFRVVAQSDGTGTEEAEPDVLYARQGEPQHSNGEEP